MLNLKKIVFLIELLLELQLTGAFCDDVEYQEQDSQSFHLTLNFLAHCLQLYFPRSRDKSTSASCLSLTFCFSYIIKVVIPMILKLKYNTAYRSWTFHRGSKPFRCFQMSKDSR